MHVFICQDDFWTSHSHKGLNLFGQYGPEPNVPNLLLRRLNQHIDMYTY